MTVIGINEAYDAAAVAVVRGAQLGRCECTHQPYIGYRTRCVNDAGHPGSRHRDSLGYTWEQPG